MTFEHRHENKSCSAGQEWVNERLRDWLLSIDMKVFQVFNDIPGSQLLSDVQKICIT